MLYLVYKLKTINEMETIAQNREYKVMFNGSKTYFVMDGETCYFATSSKTKAINRHNKTLKLVGIAN